jgi:hypothetical protein
MKPFRNVSVLGLFVAAGVGLARPAPAAEPLKVFCVARPPAADADEKTRQDQAEAPKAVEDVTSWLKSKKKEFTVVESREAAELVIEITSRHLPKFGRRSITFDLTVGATPLGTRKAAAGTTWTNLSGQLVGALIDWTQKADKPLRAALASRPQPAAEADRTALVQWLNKFLEPG